MIYRTFRNRIKIPDRVAGLAALLIVLSSFAGPQLELTDSQESLAQQDNSLSVDESVTELVGAAVSAAPPFNFNISSLIFRF